MMQDVQTRLRGTFLFIAMFVTLAMVVMVYTSRADASFGGSGNAAISSGGHETEHPSETRTVHPDSTGTRHAEPSETEHPHATETRHPEGTETEHPHATETRHPESTETEHPHATETQRPHATETARPHATETEHPHATETLHPEGTETQRPHATETRHPEGTETEHPHATETRHPESTETEHPHATRTPHGEPTGTRHAEPSETRHPEGTETQQPHATETEHPHATGTVTPQAPVPGTGSRTFSQTGKTVSGVFLQRWDSSGGLAQQGYPISAPMNEVSDLNGKAYTVQYFERSVMELHPENAAPNNVLLSQLGTLRYRRTYSNGAPTQTENKASGHLFTETNHWTGGLFLKYWNEHGGLAQQGYPISGEFTEVSPLDGKTYTVQYFERAVFELHPENAAPNNVLLSQLGTFQQKQKYNGK